MSQTPLSQRVRNFSAVISLGTVVIASAAQADPPGPAYWLYDRSAVATFERGQFYGSFTLKAGVQQLPRFNSNLSVFDEAVASKPFSGPSPLTRHDVLGVQPGGEIGYAFRDGTFPAWMGRRVRIGLYGSVSSARTNENRASAVPHTLVVTYFGVSGALQTNLGYVVPTTVQPYLAETLQVRRDAYQVGLKLESDIALGPNLSLTPAFAVFGGRVADSYVYNSVIHAVGITDITPNGTNERVRTDEIGGHLGARLTWQIHPAWAVHIGGTAGPVWLHSGLTASDCLGGIPGGPAPICGPETQLFASTNATDRRWTVGFRSKATLGLVTDLRFAVISLGGFMRYDSQIPGIVNPQLTTNLPLFIPTPTAAHMRFHDGFAYGGFLTLRVPIPY